MLRSSPKRFRSSRHVATLRSAMRCLHYVSLVVALHTPSPLREKLYELTPSLAPSIPFGHVSIESFSVALYDARHVAHFVAPLFAHSTGSHIQCQFPVAYDIILL